VYTVLNLTFARVNIKPQT